VETRRYQFAARTGTDSVADGRPACYTGRVPNARWRGQLSHFSSGMGTALTEPPSNRPPRVLRLAAVGDFLLTDGQGGAAFRPERLDGVRPLLEACDLVLGNLECTLPGDEGVVATEPRVIATPESIRAAVGSTFRVVTLANNHAFDCFASGFRRVKAVLDDLGVAHVGAGETLAEAEAPAVLDVRGVRVAFLGAVDERTGRTPVATADGPGVAPFDVSRLADRIGDARAEAAHVVVCVHWGEERFRIPSPAQIERGRRLVEAGASLVIGHHPHVVQGMETYLGRSIAYSLGNFIANEVPFTGGDRVTWTRAGRTGAILTADLSADGGVTGATLTPTYDSGSRIEIDRTGFGDRHIARAKRALARGVTLGRYRREYFLVKTVRPALAYLRWSRLRRLRLRHIRKALAGLFHAAKAE